HGAAPLLDAPAGDRIQRRSAEGGAGTQAETGMMPRATDRVADQKAVGQRGAIMRAEGADREHLASVPRQQHGFPMCVPKQHRAVGYLRKRDTIDEVRSAESVLGFVHSICLTSMVGDSPAEVTDSAAFLLTISGFSVVEG